MELIFGIFGILSTDCCTEIDISFFWFGFHQGQSGACGFCIIAGGSLNTYCDSQLGVGETCSDLAAWKSNKSLSYPFSVVPF